MVIVGGGAKRGSYCSVTIVRDEVNFHNSVGMLGEYFNVWTIVEGGLHFFVHIESNPLSEEDYKKRLEDAGYSPEVAKLRAEQVGHAKTDPQV